MAHMDPGIRIQYAAIPVDDQANAELFYIEKLGFHIIDDVPVGEHRWLTVSSSNGMEGVELLLEPNVLPATRTYQAELHDQGIPVTTFTVDDMEHTVDVLRDRGVTFTMEPMEVGNVIIARFDDTCGNLIQLTQRI